MHSKSSLKSPEIYLLMLVAFLTRFWQLFTPNAVVFDEVYFKQFAAAYFSHSYFFDIHPPLGKLLLAGWGWMLGLNANVLQNSTAVGLRLLPALAGALIIPLFYALLRRLHLSRQIAALGALFLLFDNALLVESRFILNDSLLILFALTGLYFFLWGREADKPRSKIWLYLLSGCAIGLSISVKWTGLGTLGVVGLIMLSDMLKSIVQKDLNLPKLNKIVVQGLTILIPAALVYILTFWIHFALLTKTGPGDAFMSVGFQKSLSGNAYYDPLARLSFSQKFIELNREMYQASATLTATHPYGSQWYSWPLMLRSVYYWTGSTGNAQTGYIYLLGNPLVWWLSLAGLILSLGYILVQPLRAKLGRAAFALGLFWLSYILNLAPFITVTRVLFLYHYFFSLIAAVAITVITLGMMLGWNHASDSRFWHFPSPASRWTYIGLASAIIAVFIFFAPISYGTPLNISQLQNRMWLPSWR